jgi:hypothetical protein
LIRSLHRPTLSSRGGKGIGENKSALLWKPKRCLITTATVIEGNEPSRKVSQRLDSRQPTAIVVLKPDHVRDVDSFVRRYHARALGPRLFFP